MAVTDKSWDGSPSKYPNTNSFCSACLIDTNKPGEDKVQANCKLPIREPNGDINKNALGAASAALAGARGGLKDVSPADKKKAARALMKAYSEAQMPPPPSLKNMAQ